MMYTEILLELYFKASPNDISTLLKSLLLEKEEPPHFRVEASFALGDQRDHKQGADVCL